MFYWFFLCGLDQVGIVLHVYSHINTLKNDSATYCYTRKNVIFSFWLRYRKKLKIFFYENFENFVLFPNWCFRWMSWPVFSSILPLGWPYGLKQMDFFSKNGETCVSLSVPNDLFTMLKSCFTNLFYVG